VTAPAAAAAEAFARRAWTEVHGTLATVPRDALDAVDLERLAVAAYLTGRQAEAVAALEVAHARNAEQGDVAAAARCAFWTAFFSMMQGQMAHAGGWLARAQATMGDLECPAAGYVLIPQLLGALDGDDPGAARDLAVRAGEIASRFGDRDLAAFATLGHGQALLALGDEVAGLARLDEVMVSVTAGEVGPVTSGIVYCAVILECMQLFDLARAGEWTAALDSWCAAQPDLVPYKGQCLVHESQLQQAAGDWATARATVLAACDRLTDPPHPALGLACYQEGELRRLAGEREAAAAAYRRASGAGYEPMPGLALLELARGDLEAASAGIRRALGEAGQPFQRPGLLAAAVEIHGTAGDVAAARAAADELAAIAGTSRSSALGAMAAHAVGSARLAEGSPADALVHLRAAKATWQQLRMPYDAARTSELIGRCCLALDDRSSAALELDNARETFDRLGARPDLDRLATVHPGDGAGGGEGDVGAGPDALSEREREVLAQVAAGKTNREVADALSISVHTVGRHLENVFAKLGVRTRAAATAYAYEHRLL
jgi:DNA-binding CsgD family transcriptional regulator